MPVGAQTKQARRTAHKARIRRERHVAALDEFDDFVFLAVVLQFHILRVEIEGRVGVVVQVQIDLVADFSRDVQVDFLVEVHRCRLAVADGQRWVVDILHRHAELQFCRASRRHAHTARTEDFLRRTEVEVHIGEVEFLLAFRLVDFVVFRAKKLAKLLFRAPVEIFRRRHHNRRGNPLVADFRADDVAVERVVVLHLLLHILRTLQVGGILVEVVVGDGRGALNLPARVQQRVGNLLIVVDDGLFGNIRRFLVVFRGVSSRFRALIGAIRLGKSSAADHQNGQHHQSSYQSPKHRFISFFIKN